MVERVDAIVERALPYLPDLVAIPFEFAFLRNALYAGLLIVVASSLIGTWMVLRGMAFMGEALGHGVLPGVAIAYVVGGELLIGAAVAAAVMIGGVTLASARSRLGEDVSIGLLFVGMLALGVAIISREGAYAGDLITILFGQPLGVTTADVTTTAIAAAGTGVATVLLYRPFLVLAFSRTKAQALGMRPAVAHLVMLALIAAVVIASFRTIGTLLVFALLVAPPATAALVSRRVPMMMAVSTLFGALAVVAGLLVSYHQATAAGPTIAGLSVLGFFVVLTGVELCRRVARVRASRAPRPV